jgi:hypothetical protein
MDGCPIPRNMFHDGSIGAAMGGLDVTKHSFEEETVFLCLMTPPQPLGASK